MNHSLPGQSLLTEPAPEDCRGLVRVADSAEGYSRFACIKCGSQSGNSWGQCGGRCPSEQSPHFDPACLEECLTKGPSLPPEEKAVIRTGIPRPHASSPEFSRWTCCNAEKRNMDGWCTHCGNPCL